MSPDSYITCQLIPYIGNKRALIPLIRSAIELTGLKQGTFCDAFAGSGVVARLAKSMGLRVIANDWEPYSYYLNTAYIAANRPPDFRSLGGLEKAISTLNELSPLRGFISAHYCPEDDENYDPDTERMFYTQENGRRIDAIREKIVEWKEACVINDMENAVLLAPLIYQASYCSNTSGVFKGFHRGWGGATKTAWYRIRSILTLSPPLFWDNSKENVIHKADANELLCEIESDILYLDPPYNQHQYGSNYHILNTVALWDKPEVKKDFDLRTPGNGKAAIREDWRVDRKSAYCYKHSASAAFRELVYRARTKYILVSYSTDGIIGFDDLIDTLAEKGRLQVVTKRYKRYRVSSQRPSAKSHNVEFVVIVDTSKNSNRANRTEVKQAVHAEHTGSQMSMVGTQTLLF